MFKKNIIKHCITVVCMNENKVIAAVCTASYLLAINNIRGANG